MIKKITADTKEKLSNKNFIVGTSAVKDTVENGDKIKANYFPDNELNEKSIKVGTTKWLKAIPYDEGVFLIWKGKYGNNAMRFLEESVYIDVAIKAWDFIYHDAVNNKNYSLIDWINSKQNSATAINTSNIGSQSVANAANAVNADTVDGHHHNYTFIGAAWKGDTININRALYDEAYIAVYINNLATTVIPFHIPLASLTAGTMGTAQQFIGGGFANSNTASSTVIAKIEVTATGNVSIIGAYQGGAVANATFYVWAR